jgi:rhodanese-related sulfurtransferase
MAQLIEFCLRHPLLVGATVAAVVAALFYEIRLRGQSGFSVPPARAIQMINQGATVVDLRDAESFGGGHIVDALNLTPADLSANPEAKLKKKRPVLLVCDNGSASARAAADLRKAGFENAWAVEGGLAAWLKDNLPVVAERARAKAGAA